jgi:hypothetical protein
VARVPSLRSPGARFVAVALVLTFAGTLLQARYYFDRYLVLVLPFAIATTLVMLRDAAVRAGAWALAAALALYGVAGTHDYLARHRSRAALLASLADRGVPPTAIDGGMEFNAWHLAPILRTAPTDAAARPGKPLGARSWWWVVDDQWLLASRPLPGYRVARVQPFARWLPPGEGRVFLLEREGGTTTAH